MSGQTVVILAVVALTQAVLMMWAIGDLAKRPIEAWNRIEQSQIRWAAIIMLAFIIGPLGYMLSMRSKLAAAEAELDEEEAARQAAEEEADELADELD